MCFSGSTREAPIIFSGSAHAAPNLPPFGGSARAAPSLPPFGGSAHAAPSLPPVLLVGVGLPPVDFGGFWC